MTSAIEKLKGRDKVGVVSEYASTAGGIAAGAVVASKVAAVAGASTLFGSTTLATALGGLLRCLYPRWMGNWFRCARRHCCLCTKQDGSIRCKTGCREERADRTPSETLARTGQ